MIERERNTAGNWVIPNTSPRPNRYDDELMRLLTPEEWKVFSYACRHILGYQDHVESLTDRIAVSQYVTGCGMCDKAVRRALGALDTYRVLVVVRKANGDRDITPAGQMYQILEDDDNIDWKGLYLRAATISTTAAERMLSVRSAIGTGERDSTPVTALQGLNGITGEGCNGITGEGCNGVRRQKQLSKQLSKPHIIAPTEITSENGEPVTPWQVGAQPLLSPEPAAGKPKAKRASHADPRSNHPAIIAVRQLRGGKYPPSSNYDDLIKVLGDSPDVPWLTECRKVWEARGKNTNALGWALDWYANGIEEWQGGKATRRLRGTAEQTAPHSRPSRAIIAEVGK